jgi:hypothetical protein
VSDSGDSGGSSNAVKYAVGTLTGMGCLLSPLALMGAGIVVIIIGGLGILLAPLVALILLFGGGGGDGEDPEATATRVSEILQGDGDGELDSEQVPEEYLESVQDAGAVCDVVGPVVIASQIERESHWEADFVGDDGSEGLSQLPKDIFDEYGGEDASPTDGEDSIAAQGEYMCDLADQMQEALDDGEVIGKVLDLTLAAYDAGPDAVIQAGGVPTTSESQGYVVGVRALFAQYEGVGATPPSFDESDDTSQDAQQEDGEVTETPGPSPSAS